MADVSITVGGFKYGGWKTARVTRGIESVSGSFELSVSERWANLDKPWPILEGDECEVFVGGERVISGYVDQVRPEYNESDHTLTISGRDKTGDLVDCSALPDGPFEFKSSSLVSFAKRICDQHGIKVKLQSGLSLPATPKKLHVDPGETGFAAIEQACRSSGVLPVSDGAGGLVLTQAGQAQCDTALIEGKNIKSAAAAFNASGRFARYVVKGQHAASDDFFGKPAAAISGTATDKNVTRATRVLVVRAEGNVTKESAKKRAEWEASVRAGRSTSASVTVQGWKQPNGKLWPVNAFVRLKSPRLRIDGVMLITEATYEVSDRSGTTTTLTLKRPDAYKPEPDKPVKADNTWRELAKGV